MSKTCIQAVIALYGACTRSCDISEAPEVTCKVATQVATVTCVTHVTLAFPVIIHVITYIVYMYIILYSTEYNDVVGRLYPFGEVFSAVP